MQKWKESIDLLLIDGDHAEGGRGARLGGLEPFCKTRRNGDFSRCENFPERLDHTGVRSGQIGRPVFSERRELRTGAIVEEIHSLFVVRRNR